MNRRDLLKAFPGALVVAAVPGVIAGAAVAKVAPAFWDAPKATRVVSSQRLSDYFEVIRFGVHPPHRTENRVGTVELSDQAGHLWVRNNFNHLNGYEWIALPEERFVIQGAPVLKLSEDFLTGHVVTRDAETPRAVRIWDFDQKNGMQQRHAYRTEAVG